MISWLKRIILTVTFILLDQGIKLYIYNYIFEKKIEIIKNLIYFQPLFNRQYSWINSLFGLGLGKALHIILGIAVVGFMLYIFLYNYKKNKESNLIDFTFIFMMSGAFCSLIDKIFWDGSLDYIYLNNLFTFDLKDIYIDISIILLVFVSIKHKDFFDLFEKKKSGDKESEKNE